MFRTRSPDWASVALGLGAVLLAFYLLPVASLLFARPPGEVLAALTTARVVDAAGTSLATATVSTLLAVVFGLPLSYWLARTDSWLAKPVLAVVVLPLVVPPVVAGMVLLTIVGPSTPLGEAAAGVGIELTRSVVAIVLAQTFVASPFVVVTARAALSAVDPTMEEASRTLGHGRLSTIRRVTLPVAWPGVLAGITLAFARALGEFGATITLAYYPRTLPVEIWVAFTTRGVDAAFPVAVVLLVVSLLALGAINALGNPYSG